MRTDPEGLAPRIGLSLPDPFSNVYFGVKDFALIGLLSLHNGENH